MASFISYAWVLLITMAFFGDSARWSVQAGGLDTNLRGISVKAVHSGEQSHYSIWASGSNGVVLHSTDDGKTWKQLSVTGAESLDFRDIESFGDDTAYLMSSGDGDKSRIYKTTDGGASWKLQYSDDRPGFFLDSLACDSIRYCVALSDPVEGKFLLLATDDGEHWNEVPRQQMPAALPREGSFAASGTAITLCDGKIFFATGGPAARVFRSADHGRSWLVVETPIASGNASSGIFSIACLGGRHLVAVGGDYRDPNRAEKVAAYSEDSGKTWDLSQTQPGGYRSAVGLFQGNLLAVGPNGTDISRDKGIHWQHLDSQNLNAVSAVGESVWAVGPKGTIVSLNSPF